MQQRAATSQSTCLVPRTSRGEPWLRQARATAEAWRCPAPGVTCYSNMWRRYSDSNSSNSSSSSST